MVQGQPNVANPCILKMFVYNNRAKKCCLAILSWGRNGFDGGTSGFDCSKVATHRQKTITDNTVKPWMLGSNNRVLARA